MHPPAGSNLDLRGKRKRVNKLFKTFIGFLLGFVRVFGKNAHKLPENRIPIMRHILWGGNRAMGLKGRPDSKIKTKPAQNIVRSNPKKILSKTIESLKKTSRNRMIVPARWGEGGKCGVGNLPRVQ